MADEFDHIFISPSNFDASLGFYKDGLGWSMESSWGGDGEPRGAALTSTSGFKLVIAERHESLGDHAQSHGYIDAKPTIYVRVDDVDQRYDQLASRKQVVIPPENTHWGIRWFVTKDPDNNLIAFCSGLKKDAD